MAGFCVTVRLEREADGFTKATALVINASAETAADDLVGLSAHGIHPNANIAAGDALTNLAEALEAVRMRA